MFCKNCGKLLNEGDLFCGECGTPVSEQTAGNNAQGEKTYKVEVQVPAFNLDGVQVLKLAKIYFTRPISFFKEFKNCDNIKTAAVMTIALPFIYAVLSIIYASTTISAFFSSIKKIPQFLAKSGIISFNDAIQAQAEISSSQEFYAFKASFKNMVDYKKIFGSSFIQLLAIMIITFIILELINVVIIKNRIKASNIFFVTSCSFTPLVLSFALASIVNFVSILCGTFIIIFGYALSFITLYSGLKELSDEKNDKVFIVMTILFILMSIVTTVTVTKQIESSLLEIRNIFDSIDNFI